MQSDEAQSGEAAGSGEARSDQAQSDQARSEEAQSGAAAQDSQAAQKDAAGSTARAPAQKRRAAPVEPPSEAEIDSPTLRTLWLLGVVFIVTAASWGAARFACNYHPPQSRPPPEVPTDRLARTPRGSAVEAAHRFRTKNFAGARELAKGPLATELDKAQAQCEQQGATCVKERSRLQKTVLTTGIVTELEADSAVALITHHVDGAQEKVEVRVERDGAVWKAVSTRRL